jgi:hypothetical protein
VADSVTFTGALYQPLAQAPPLQAMAVAGGVLSIWICWEFAGSALPTVSTEKNFTVAVAGTVNGPVYTVLDVVGAEPSVV